MSALILIFALPAQAQVFENIELYSVDISVDKESTFEISEEITYLFAEPRHGIYRCIPTVHQDPASSFLKERYFDVELLGVRQDGSDARFTEERKRDSLCIRIGDPETEIEGMHTYEISYVVRGAVTYLEYAGAELYWNVTGNDWEVPMRYVEARVTSPDGVLIRERACYQGKEGDATSCQASEENGAVVFRGKFLAAGEGLTISQALNRNTIAYDVRERYKSFLIASILGLLLLVAGAIVLYRYKTRFKTGRTIIPQYEPYPGVKPMYAGLLFDKRLDPRDLTAGILYLAKEGFLKIRKIETKVLFFFEVDDFEMVLQRPIAELSNEFEKELMLLIFKDEGAPIGTKITLRQLKSDTERGRKNAKRLRLFNATLKEDLKQQGFYSSFDFMFIFKLRFIIPLVLFAIVLKYVSNISVMLLFGAVLIMGIMLSEGRRTKKGYEALDHLKGFKDFLSVTEKERYIFHNAPERNAEQFMEYLPYAIAFGVEKQWAKTFEGITIPNPDWYEGDHVRAFDAVNLSRSLGAFSSAFASASGTSASSGGGHSGGGSGGGGGGSW